MYINILYMFAFLLIPASINLHFAYSQSIPYVVEVWDGSIANNSRSSEENTIQDVPQNCSQALEEFVVKVNNLTRCTILNARPVRVCTNCEEEINATHTAYKRLREESSTCKTFLFENDQVRIVDVVYRQGIDLWLKLFCGNCYDHISETKTFFKVSQDLDNCLKDFNETSKGLNNTCSMCQEYFVKMNDIYKVFVQRISDDENGRVCMDIVDQMNITRHVWSSQNCLRFDSNIGYPNIVTAVIVGCIPVFFYMISKSISIIEDVKLVRPKRKSYSSLQSESFQAE